MSHMKAKEWGRLGRTRPQHPLTRVRTEDRLGPISLQHILASAKTGRGSRQAGSEKSLTQPRCELKANLVGELRVLFC